MRISTTDHCSDGKLEEFRLCRVKLIEQQQRFVDHLVVFIVGQIHKDRRDLIRIKVGCRIEHCAQLTHALLL